MKAVVFEDEEFKNLLPLIYFRPVWELRCGAFSLWEKMSRELKDVQRWYFTARTYLNKYYLPTGSIFDPDSAGELLLVNGRLLMQEGDGAKLNSLKENQAFVQGNSVIALRIKEKKLSAYFRDGILQTERVLADFPTVEADLRLMDYPWDFIDANGEEIRNDFLAARLGEGGEGKSDDGVHILGKENVYLAAGSRVMPGVVLNAEDGPIWIDEGATVMPNAVLEGPLYVGRNSLIKIGAKIYENTSIGPVCKVGGEVEETIIQEYSNKQHDGFLGHSFLGAWINIGADTNNSDLKNNYSEISVYLNGTPVKTGKRFLGLIMGDHSKTAINTMFNTGTIAGINCNIYGAGFPPKFIPSFSWGGSSGLREYNFDKAIEVAKVVMSRRKVEFTERHLRLFRAAKTLAEQVENRARMR